MAPPSQATDQVGAILRGLNLDKSYFYKHIIPYDARIKIDEPISPVSSGAPQMSPTSAVKSKRRQTTCGPAVVIDNTEVAKKRPQRKSMAPGEKGKRQSNARGSTAGNALARKSLFGGGADNECISAMTKSSDFDLYLSEQIVPLLSQAIDALGRELIRQEKLGKTLDEAVRRRFNPVTWIAQFMLRNNPKLIMTPRRTKVYAQFRGWTDLERGRRELLRRRDWILKDFNGFSRNRVVKAEDIPKLFSALDQKWWLEGRLKNHPLIPRLFTPLTSTSATVGTFTFEEFWDWFSTMVLGNDFLPYEEYVSGVKRRLAEDEKMLKEGEDQFARQEEEEARIHKREEEAARFKIAATKVRENPILAKIIDDDMYLTGAVSSLEPEIAEIETAPYGNHVKLLYSLLRELGFESLPDPEVDGEAGPTAGHAARELGRRGSELPQQLAEMSNACWWEDPALTCWTFVQKAMQADIEDGVVDRESLLYATDVENWHIVKKAVIKERERQEMLGMGDIVEDIKARLREEEDAHDMMVKALLATKEDTGDQKPSYEQLAEEFQITMPRVEWLHDQFKSMLEDAVDDYPANPACLTKPKMRELYAELKPDMTDEEFEIQFTEIDIDRSGAVEFDEFIKWISEEEIDLEEGSDEEEDPEEEEEEE